MTLKGQTRDPNSLKAQYLENYLSYRLQIWYAALYGEFRAGAQKNSPKSGRGLGHVTPTIFGSTVGYHSDSSASCIYFLRPTSKSPEHACKTDIFRKPKDSQDAIK